MDSKGKPSLTQQLRAAYSSPQRREEARACILFVVMFPPCTIVIWLITAWLYKVDHVDAIYVVVVSAILANILAYFLNRWYSNRCNRS